MKIHQVEISELKLWDKNPRKNDAAADRLVPLLKEYGFINPIICTPDMVVRAGHTRIKAAKKLGMKEVPVIIINFGSEVKAKGFSIADNKSMEFAEWDIPMLNDVFEDLKLEDFDMNLTGFDISELEDLSPSEPEIDASIKSEPETDISIKIDQFESILYEFSGGKDSSLAILKTLHLFKNKNIELVFVETGAELPCIKKHIIEFSLEYHLPLKIICPEIDILSYYMQKKRWPDPIYRDCQHKFINQVLDDYNPDALHVRGGRKSQKTTLSKGKEYQKIGNVNIWNPLFNLSKIEIEKELLQIKIWPGYSKGFKRTACWMCPFHGAQQYEALKNNYPVLHQIMYQWAQEWEYPEYKNDGTRKRFLEYWEKVRV